jgi:hypothetical protein
MHGVPCMLSTRKQPSSAMPVTDHKPLSLGHGTPWAIGRCGGIDQSSIGVSYSFSRLSSCAAGALGGRKPRSLLRSLRYEPSYEFRLVGDTACWARLRQGSAMICTRILLAPGQSARLRHCSPI